MNRVMLLTPSIIVAIFGLGLLVSLCAAIYGWDLNLGLLW
jgi:ABC-type phosphate transport system permease subunit